MTKEEVEKILAQIKPIFVPPSGSLEVISVEGTEIKLKAVGLPDDVFQVQGKIIRSGDEIRNKIAGRLKAVWADAVITFV
jgi:hypothetical protein